MATKMLFLSEPAILASNDATTVAYIPQSIFSVLTFLDMFHQTPSIPAHTHWNWKLASWHTKLMLKADGLKRAFWPSWSWNRLCEAYRNMCKSKMKGEVNCSPVTLGCILLHFKPYTVGIFPIYTCVTSVCQTETRMQYAASPNNLMAKQLLVDTLRSLCGLIWDFCGTCSYGCHFYFLAWPRAGKLCCNCYTEDTQRKLEL